MRSLAEREQLAKEWLVRIVERTRLLDVGELPLQWLVAEAPGMIAEILGTLADPASRWGGGPRRRGERAHQTAGLAAPGRRRPRADPARSGGAAGGADREPAARGPGAPARTTSPARSTRLAEAFGAIQGGVTKALVEERSGGAARDRLTGLPGRAQLDEWLRILLAEHRRYGHPFAMALIDIDGLARINESRGRSPGTG